MRSSLFLIRGVVKARNPESPTADELVELGVQLAEERTRSHYGEATQRIVQLLQLQYRLGDHLGGVVESTTAILLNRLLRKLGELDDEDPGLVVRGHVTLPDGGPAVGYSVRAGDRDLRTVQPLGTDVVTDNEGAYEIPYSRTAFATAEAGGADLVVRVYAPGADPGTSEPSAESPTVFDAPVEAEVDVALPAAAPLTEYPRYLETVVPVLVGQAADGGPVPLAELTDADLDFLAADTSIDRQHLAWLATAFALSARTGDPIRGRHNAHREGSVPAALFYGWFREGLPDDWERLIEQSLRALRVTALAAIEHEVIPAELAESLDTALRALPAPRRDALSTAMTAAGLDEAAAESILHRAGTVEEVTNGLVSGLVEEGRLSGSDARRVGLGLLTHTLVEGDAATASAILAARPARLSEGLRAPRDLAALDVPDLERAFADAGVEPPDGETRSGYATRLAGQIAQTFPTAALLHRATEPYAMTPSERSGGPWSTATGSRSIPRCRHSSTSIPASVSQT